jgi:serine/threonine protein kinase
LCAPLRHLACHWRVDHRHASGRELTEPDKHLWSLTIQLFESVKFMHDNNVAHMDLKPGNILIPSAYGRLTIVDFGLSIRLGNKMQLRRGFAGTKGYIAPEVEEIKLFSPVGIVVKELCMLCSPSPSRDWLLDLSEELLNDDPSKRPMMSVVLERMSNFDAFDAQPNEYLRYLIY